MMCIIMNCSEISAANQLIITLIKYDFKQLFHPFTNYENCVFVTTLQITLSRVIW